MVRISVATALLLAASAPALAQDATQVCVLRSTETITAAKQPNIFETKLDCGRKPTPEQERAAALVNNAMNTADALEVVLAMGYRVAGSSWRDSFTGRQILGVYTLVGGAPVKAPAPVAELPEAVEPKPTPKVAIPGDGPIELD